jgi:restriction endonuclease S subunit
MKYSVVKSSKIDLGDRIDAEYFEPSYLENESKLKRANAEPLSGYVKLVSSAFYPSATGYYEVGEMPFIRCVDCIDYPAITELQKDKFERLPQAFINENKTIKKIKDGDIVITKVGSPCFASIVYGLGEVALSRTVLGAYQIKEIDPFYLIVFLRSKYGFEQLIRERELTIQYQLTLERVGRILTYKPSDDFQKKIRQLFIESQELYISEVEQYQKAEQLLLSELGLLDWKPKHELAFVKNFSATQEAERFDAEYFQPKYEEIIEAVKKYKGGFVTLGEVAKTKRGSLIPDSFYNEQNGTPYIRGADFSSGFLSDNKLIYIDNSFSQKSETKIKKGDIVFALIGTVGSTALVDESFNDAFISNNLGKITIKNYNPTVLQILLHSIVGKLYFEKEQTQTAQPKISDKDIHKFILPKLENKIEKEIEQKYFESQKNKKLSKSLLEIAKRSVEMAIEKDEQEAEKWIEEQLRKMKE